MHLAINYLRKGCKRIGIRSDNTTAITYVNNMGGFVSSSSDRLDRHIFLKEIPGIHIPGKENNEADYMPRLLNDNNE